MNNGIFKNKDKHIITLLLNICTEQYMDEDLVLGYVIVHRKWFMFIFEDCELSLWN